VINSVGRVESYTTNTNTQLTISSNGQVNIALDDEMPWEQYYIRVGTTTTYSDK